MKLSRKSKNSDHYLSEDSNSERREAVRMKTEKYLIKAEELYHKHLSASEEPNAPNRWGIRAVCKLLQLSYFYLCSHSYDMLGTEEE